MTHIDKVREFHEAFDHPVRTTPNADVPERVLRMNLIQEEVTELGEALDLFWCEDNAGKIVWRTWERDFHAVDTVEVADALADIDYVTQGAALTFGIPQDAVFDEVHRSNMAKVGGPVREDGKKLKPEGWTPPDIAGVLYGSN